MSSYIKPAQIGFTIYTIPNCKYCKMAKELLKSHKIKTVNAKNYVQSLRERDAFYAFIQKHTKKDYKYFPMIFYNQQFIGGFLELQAFLKRIP